MKPEKVYACYSIDKEVRLSSSSGAVFSSLAEYVFEQQGVIYGVVMSEDCYSAEFVSVTDVSEKLLLEAILLRVYSKKCKDGRFNNC